MKRRPRRKRKALGQAELVTMLEFVFQIYEVEHYASIYIT